jgi:NAD(P)H-flavin reductase
MLETDWRAADLPKTSKLAPFSGGLPSARLAVSLDPEDKSVGVPAPSQAIRVEVVELRELSRRVALLRLRAQPVQAFTWLPGQHVWLAASETGSGWVPYSIASYADPKRPGEFELAISTDGGKDMLADLGLGRTLFVSPASGSFIWLPRSGATWLIGIGTGIAPLRAMLHAALDVGTERSVTLLFGARAQADVLWNTEFTQLAERDSRFHFEPTLSQPDPGWRGRQGRVQDHLSELAPQLAGASVYVCGNTSMVADTVARLLELGLDPALISSEAH